MYFKKLVSVDIYLYGCTAKAQKNFFLEIVSFMNEYLLQDIKKNPREECVIPFFNQATGP